MAEQIESVHRQVALKIIKLGMDTKQVSARFEAELALIEGIDLAEELVSQFPAEPSCTAPNALTRRSPDSRPTSRVSTRCPCSPVAIS